MYSRPDTYGTYVRVAPTAGMYAQELSVRSPSSLPPPWTSRRHPQPQPGRVLLRSIRSTRITVLLAPNTPIPTYRRRLGRGHLSRGDSRPALAVSLVRRIPPCPRAWMLSPCAA